MIRLPTLSPAAPAKIPPPSFVSPAVKHSPAGPRSPASRWLRNHTWRQPPLQPSCLPLFRRRQVDGALIIVGTEGYPAYGYDPWLWGPPIGFSIGAFVFVEHGHGHRFHDFHRPGGFAFHEFHHEGFHHDGSIHNGSIHNGFHHGG